MLASVVSADGRYYVVSPDDFEHIRGTITFGIRLTDAERSEIQTAKELKIIDLKYSCCVLVKN